MTASDPGSGARRAIFYECFAGIAGDMHLGALVDLGVPADYLRAELARLELAGEFELVLEPGRKMGITGTRAEVRLTDAGAPRPHRHLSTIKGILERAGYAPRIARRAVAMFEAIAVAEAKIHGTSVEAVHFHEVGATDAIVDLAGAALGLDYLGIDAAYCAAIELGAGMVRCEHGIMPVPAPATAEILKGAPCRYGGVEGEATTPTGAAILRATVDAFEPPPAFRPEAIGYGIGHRDFRLPNVLRLTLGTVDARLEAETNIEVECNIDDMVAEAFAPMTEALLAAGARDVFLTPILMKKGRPGTKVSLLVDEQRLDAALDTLFSTTTTIGARLHAVSKRMLPREERVIDTALGPVRVKIAALPGGARRWKSAHDDVARIARDAGIGYPAAKDAVDRDVAQALAQAQAQE